MSKSYGLPLALSLFAAACTPPPDVPPPRFKPNPPYPPEIVDPYGPAQGGETYQEEPQQTPPPQLPPGQYPTARKTTNPNQVVSPYPPNNVIDVEGFRSGQLARDPTNNQIFRVP